MTSTTHDADPPDVRSMSTVDRLRAHLGGRLSQRALRVSLLRAVRDLEAHARQLEVVKAEARRFGKEAGRARQERDEARRDLAVLRLKIEAAGRDVQTIARVLGRTS